MITKEKKGDMSSVSFRLKRSQKKDVAGIANKLGVSTSTLLHTWVTRILNNMNGLGDHAELPRDK